MRLARAARFGALVLLAKVERGAERMIRTFTMKCVCGASVTFDDASPGTPVVCACGRAYRTPAVASALGRAVGRLRWGVRWLVAGRRHPPSAPPGAAPYRVGRAVVACPRCHVTPPGDARWQCEFCFESWDTFTTRGRCPHCDFAYAATYCAACGEFSRHRDWYRS